MNALKWRHACMNLENTRTIQFRRKMADRTYAFNRALLDLCNGAVSEKTPQILWPLWPAEYVTVFSGRTDAPEA